MFCQLDLTILHIIVLSLYKINPLSMLSILIPTYEYDCTRLVLTLFEQAAALKQTLKDHFDFEILVADDASPDKAYLSAFEKMQAEGKCRFFALKENLGRAKIRNFLASQAQYDYLLFIDCDALVCTDDFIKQYWDARHKGNVVCGALRNLEVCPPGGELRYTYEKAAEKQRPANVRAQNPYAYFTTFNVMFERKVFAHLLFDERCTEYGYEDALMGLMLEHEGHTIAHIDNPLVHNGIDQSAVYLDKIETSLRVLHRLGDPLQSASALVRLKRRLQSAGLLFIVRFLYKNFSDNMRCNLLSPKPSMLILKLYKLGYYAGLEAIDEGK